MDYKLVKINNLSGRKATFYTLLPENGSTLFDNFLKKNEADFPMEIIDIVERLQTMANDIGARVQFFKEFEGNLGDGVCAIYDLDESNLRLYCIRYGSEVVLLGDGGFKPKNISAFQEKDDLKNANYLLRNISKMMTEKMKDKEIKLTENGFVFDDDVIFTIDSDF